jgi:predicted nucleic acid-binding protein
LFIVDRTISDSAAKLRKQHGWKLPDAFQAAIAIQNNIKLSTRNTKDFNPKQHEFVAVSYILK